MRPVAPLAPVAPYIGGKSHLAKLIVARIEAVPHDTYAEAFVGMAGVFLRRRHAPRQEVINDLNGEVATFFRILQRHHTPFVEMLRYQVTARAEFDRLARSDPATLTDLERAARFLYLQRTAFGGKVSGRNFGVAVGRPGRFDVTRLVPMLAEVHERLAGVVIECLPFADFLTRYDSPATLFYLDPPYWGSEGDYGRTLFRRRDFECLAAALRALKGRFILSINDVPEIRALFAWAAIEPVETTYTIAQGDAVRHARELVIADRFETAARLL